MKDLFERMGLPSYGAPPHLLHRADAPDTSVEAAEAVDTTKLEGMVHRAIATRDGVIAADLLERFSDYPYSSITARFASLERKGLITCGPDKIKGPSGRSQRVMRSIVEPKR